MKLPRIAFHSLWLVPAMLAIAYVGTLVQFPLDYWHHLTTGRQIVATGAIAGPDTFTYTITGQPIVNQSWLAQWSMYWLHRWGGLELTQFVFAACYGVALAISGYSARRRGGSARAAAVLAFATLLLAVSNFGVRPQALSFALFAAELFVLWNWSEHWRAPWVIALIEVVWANSHGAFPLGVGLPGLFFVATAWSVWRQFGWKGAWRDRQVRILLVCVAAAAVAAFVSPHYRHTSDYFFLVASKSSQRQIDEWLPTTFGTYTGRAFYLSLPLVLALVAWNVRQVTATEAVLLVVFGLLACTAQRMVAWWALVLPPVLAPHLAALFRRWERSAAASDAPSFANLVFLAALVGLTALYTPWTRAWNPLLPADKRSGVADDEPQSAVAILRSAKYAGPVFHPLEWGAYLSWQLAPDVKIFVDGRIESYPDAVWREYQRIGNAAPDWESILSRHHVDWVLWDPQLTDRLPKALRTSNRWDELVSEANCVVFRRRR